MESRLPAIFRELEVRAAEDEARRRAREQEAVDKQRRWELARDQAILRLRESHRAEVLAQQVQRWRECRDLDHYAQELRAVAAALSGAAREAREEWLTWIEEHRRRIDPLNDPTGPPQDPEATPEALAPFMPGWSPYGPDGRWPH